MCSQSHFGMLVAILGLCLASWVVADSISNEDIQFLSHWTRLSVDALKKYESVVGSDRLLKDVQVEVFKQQHLSWPVLLKLIKLRTGVNEIGDETLAPALVRQSDQSLLVYPAWQLFRALNESGDFRATKEVLIKVASRHMTYGQASILVDAFLNKEKGIEIPESYLFTIPSDTLLRDVNATTMMTSLVGKSGKMFPSQRHALYKKLIKSSSVGELVASVTQFDVAEAMLEFMPPNVFKAGIADVREQIGKLSEKDLVNVVYFPNTLLNAWQEEIQSTNGMLATKPNLALRGLTCASLENVASDIIPDMAAAYNAHVMYQHPNRLKTFPLSLRRCFSNAVKQYLSSKANSTDQHAIMNALTLTDVKKLGGLILAGFKAHDVRLIQDEAVRNEIVHAIGQVPLAELMPIAHSERLKNFTEIVTEGRKSLSFEDLDRLGTLAFFMSSESWNSASVTAIKSFLETSLNLPHHKCVCLPKLFATSLTNTLFRVYGRPETWSATVLANLEELLVVLDTTAIESLSPKSLISALPYLLQNKTFHDRHFDSFPGFVGTVDFAEACSSWLDSDDDAKAFKASDEKLARSFLLASQLLVNLALSDASSRVRRQVSSADAFNDEFVSSVHDKTAKIVEARYQAKNLTTTQLNTIRGMIDDLTNQTSENVIRVLGLNSPPPDVESFVRDRITAGNVTSEQISAIMLFAREAQKNYVIKMAKVLNLKAADLDVPEDVFCQFLGNSNCPLPTPPTTQTPSTAQTTTPITTSLTKRVDVTASSLPSTSAPPTPLPTSSPTPYAFPSTAAPNPLIINIDSWDGSMVPMFDLRVTDTLPVNLTCLGVIAAGPAASALKAKDLRSWSVKQILNCIEVFGMIDWPKESKLEAWKLIESKMTLPSNGPMMILEGNLLEAAAILNPDSLSYNLTEAVEPLSLLGEFELPGEVVVRLADKIVAANGFETLLYHFNESTVFQLESLKHILCGFSVDFIEMLIKSATDKRSLLHCLGLIRSCENRNILESLAKQAKTTIAQPWKASDVMSLGLIVAGLSPTEFAALDSVALSGVTAAAIRHLTPEHFLVLNADKLSAIPLDSMSVLRITQLPKEGSSVLDAKQIEALSASLDTNLPLAKLIRSFEAKTDPEIVPEAVQPSSVTSSAIKTGQQLFFSIVTTAIVSLALSVIL